jgi:hypothetical protein
MTRTLMLHPLDGASKIWGPRHNIWLVDNARTHMHTRNQWLQPQRPASLIHMFPICCAARPGLYTVVRLALVVAAMSGAAIACV